MPDVHTFSADELSILMNSVPVPGVAPDTFLSVSMNDQAYNVTTGATGMTQRNRTGILAGTFKLTLMAGSIGNDMLTEQMLADRENDRGVFSFFVKDLRGRSLFQSSSTWVQQMPDKEFGTDASTVEWTLASARIDAFVGGMIGQGADNGNN